MKLPNRSNLLFIESLLELISTLFVLLFILLLVLLLLLPLICDDSLSDWRFIEQLWQELG